MKVIETFFDRCISLHIMKNHEVPGYLMKDPEGYWNSFDLSWCIKINYDISQSPMGKSFRVSWKIMICHDLHHNISERWFPLSFCTCGCQLFLTTLPIHCLTPEKGVLPALNAYTKTHCCLLMHICILYWNETECAHHHHFNTKCIYVWAGNNRIWCMHLGQELPELVCTFICYKTVNYG